MAPLQLQDRPALLDVARGGQQSPAGRLRCGWWAKETERCFHNHLIEVGGEKNHQRNTKWKENMLSK